MKAWLKYGLYFGIIAFMLSFIENWIIKILIQIPILPLRILYPRLVSLIDDGSFFRIIIKSILYFIGYFMGGMVIGIIKTIENRKKKMILIAITIIIFAISVLFFIYYVLNYST